MMMMKMMMNMNAEAGLGLKQWVIPSVALSCHSWDYPLVNYHSYGKSRCLMGKFAISMVIFNSHVSLLEGNMDL
jgi:hypothetical protein